jgi:hypothetical protein
MTKVESTKRSGAMAYISSWFDPTITTHLFHQDFNPKRKIWIEELIIHNFYSNATKSKKQRKPIM